MKLICYFSGGYPDFESANRLAHAYADAGVDTLEIDFPSSNPFVDAPYIQQRMKKALEHCNDLDKYLEAVAQIKSELPGKAILLTIYESSIVEIGIEKFCAFCRENDLLDVIVTGLTGDDVKDALIAGGVHVSCYVPFDLPETDVELALSSNGFCYLQAVPTQAQVNAKHPDLASCINYLRNCGLKNPIYCGVGVHSPKEAKMVRDAGADGVFVGSAVLKLTDDLPAMTELIGKFKAVC